MAKLYEIDKAIEDLIDKETGEIKDEATFEELKMEKAEKVRNIALLVKNLRSDAASYKAEEDAFKARRQAAEAKADWLTGYLKKHLNGEAVKDTQFEITWRKSTATDVFDESKIPVDYKKWIAPKVDKDAIGRALKAGQDVPGARLVERQNMSIK
jgi:gamma-glutamyl phosphate reductase